MTTSRSIAALALLAFCSVVPGAVAGGEVPFHGWEQQLRSDASLNAVWAADKDRIWAVGDRGVILTTVDGGRTWHSQESKTTARLHDVMFLDAKRGWIVGAWLEPHTRLSRGVLLQTVDGGAHWSQVDTDLPGLCTIQFANEMQGWAAGDWSAAYTTSLFETIDGGRTWQPLPASDLGPVVAAAGGTSRPLVLRNGLCLARPSQFDPHAVTTADRAFRAAAAHEQVIAYAGGNRVAVSVPGRPLQVESPDSVLTGYNLCSTTFAGDKLWVAGRTEGRMWYRTAGGWQFVQTPLTGRVNDLHSAEGTIVAAGSFGQILISRDAGQHWYVARGERCRAGAVVFAPSAAALPAATVTQLAGEENLRVVTTLINQNESPDPLAADLATEGQSATLALGGNECITLPDERDPRRLAESIGSVIRSYRPQLVMIAKRCDRETANQIAQIAQQIDPGLLVLQQNEFERGGVTVNLQMALPAWGTTVQSHVGQAESRMRGVFAAADETWNARRSGGGAPIRAQRELIPTAFLISAEAQREVRNGNHRYLGLVQARTRYPEIIEKLVESAATAAAGDIFEKNLIGLVEKLPADHVDEVLFMIMQYTAQRQRTDLWRACLPLVIERAGDRGLGRLAALQYRAIERSAEWQLSDVTAVPIATASYEAPFDTTAPRSPFVHQERLQQRAQSLERIQPQSTRPAPAVEDQPIDLLFSAHPAHLLLHPDPPKAQLKRWHQSRSSGPWREVIAARAGPPLHPHPIRFASDRPNLDGVLDEGLWQYEKKVAAKKLFWQLGYDSEFLFLAAAWPGEARTKNQHRGRDENLDSERRLALEFDIDGDLMTAFQLEIGAGGATRDGRDGFLDWQPHYFVSTESHDGWIYVEVAIPRSNMVKLPPVAGDRWWIRCRILEAEARLPYGPAIDPVGWEPAVFQ